LRSIAASRDKTLHDERQAELAAAAQAMEAEAAEAEAEQEIASE
jgi:hypothetical protein